MARVKSSVASKKRKREYLKLAKGYWGARHRWYKLAREAVERALVYAYRDRKARKREFRKLWIQRINAACRQHGLSYSKFINGLRLADVAIDRKMLADLAVNEPEHFAQLVEVAKTNLESAGKTF